MLSFLHFYVFPIKLASALGKASVRVITKSLVLLSIFVQPPLKQVGSPCSIICRKRQPLVRDRHHFLG